MSKYFLGVDVGGTKSHALITDHSGKIVGFGKAGTGNHEAVGYAGLIDVLNTTTEAALAQAGITREQIAGAGFGLCGYDWPSERQAHLDAVATLGLSAPVELVNDAVISLIAGAEAGWGISLVAGTGANCWGRDAQGRHGHVTGFGQIFGEAGGGSELVQRALWAIAHHYTLLGPPTVLTERFMQHYGAQNAEALLEGYTSGLYRVNAGDALLVFDAAQAGDAVALDLIRWVGGELGNLAIAVIRQLALHAHAFDVVLGGNFYRGHRLIIEMLSARILQEAPLARIIRLHADPVVGGALLGMEVAGCDPATIANARRALTRQPAT